MDRLRGRTALVTGGGRGIGRAIALAFAREGADVAIRDHRADLAERTSDEIAGLGRQSLAVAADVGDEAQVTAAFAQVEAGLGRIDMLVNNAGIDTTACLADMPAEMWDEISPTAVMRAADEGSYHIGASLNPNGGDVMI